MNFLILAFTLMFSAVSFAQDIESYTYAAGIASEKIEGEGICRERAYEKLVASAGDNGVFLATFRLIGEDRRFFNPSHYAWYEIDILEKGTHKVKTLRTLVQLNRLTGSCY